MSIPGRIVLRTASSSSVTARSEIVPHCFQDIQAWEIALGITPLPDKDDQWTEPTS